MQRTLRALAAGGLIAVLLVAPAGSAETFDGTYTGTVTRFPEQDLVEIVLSEVIVTVTGTAISGVERFTAVRTPDYGQFTTVQVEGTQWVEFSGTIAADGTFRVPGVTHTSFRILSCEGNASSCGNVFPPTGGEGPVEVAGSIASGVLTAEIIWPGNTTGTYAVLATDPAFTPATTTTTATPPTSTTGVANPPGVVERDGVLEITSPPGGVLELTRADLPAWARDAIVTAGATHVTVGPPGTIVGGDDRVLLDGLPVARVGDLTSQGGVVATGSSVILINGVPAAIYGSMVVTPLIVGSVVPAIGGPIVRPECATVPVGPDCRDPGWRPLSDDASIGDRRIVPDDDTSWEVGDGVLIGDDPATVDVAVVTGRGSLLLDRPLRFPHPAGTPVIRVPTAVVDQVVPPMPGPPLGFLATLAGLGVVGWAGWRWWQMRAAAHPSAR